MKASQTVSISRWQTSTDNQNKEIYKVLIVGRLHLTDATCALGRESSANCNDSSVGFLEQAALTLKSLEGKIVLLTAAWEHCWSLPEVACAEFALQLEVFKLFVKFPRICSFSRQENRFLFLVSRQSADWCRRSGSPRSFQKFSRLIIYRRTVDKNGKVLFWTNPCRFETFTVCNAYKISLSSSL